MIGSTGERGGSRAAIGAVHGLLLALTGRIDEQALSVARALLAEEWVAEAAGCVLDAAVESGTAVTEGERDLLAGVLVHRQREQDLVAALRVGEGPGSAAPAVHAAAPDAADEAVRSALSGVVGATGAWRGDLLLPGGAAQPLWLVEVADRDGADLAVLAGAIGRVLAGAGVPVPAVDVVDRTGWSPRRALAVRAEGRRIWPGGSGADLRLARIYDGHDDEGGPCFDTGRERLTGARRVAVLARLQGGAVVLVGDRELDDVLAGGSGAVPNVFRTDGSWIWHDAVAHYLSVYGIAPEPGLLGHLEETDGIAAVTEDVVARALAVLERV